MVALNLQDLQGTERLTEAGTRPTQQPASESQQRTVVTTSSSATGSRTSTKPNRPSQTPLSTQPSSAQAVELKSFVPDVETPPLVQAPGIRAVKAVIGDSLGQGNYIVHCYPPTSPKFDIRLPEVVIPSDLRTYGQPVFVSLDVQNGYRRPVITPREITEPPPRLPEDDAIENWLDSLEC
jgi:hypothetical protein